MKYFLQRSSILLLTFLLLNCKKTETDQVSQNNITSYHKTSGVIDADGNVYDTIVIGTQTWMLENLQTTHYIDGSTIPNIVDSTQWNNASFGAYCNYNNDSSYVKIYGRLYNWFAVNNTAGLCPAGWHIPTDSEWSILVSYLGGDSIAGGSMKATGISLWNPPNYNATDASGFTALPGGNRLSDDFFYGINNYAHFWSSTLIDSVYSWSRYLYYNDSKIYKEYSEKQVGFSCRCIEN
jgi:uncharacterized protein (TIGR02145 family)